MENKNNNLNLKISNEWKNTFPGATVGLLVIKNTINPQKSSALDNEMKNVENEIRNRFLDSGREGIRELNTIKALVILLCILIYLAQMILLVK